LLKSRVEHRAATRAESAIGAGLLSERSALKHVLCQRWLLVDSCECIAATRAESALGAGLFLEGFALKRICF
jgi:hypothetical protein